VWERVQETKPGEAERRIREHVRPWLQEARKLKYTRSWHTERVNGVSEYVDRWFGGQETQAQKKETKAGEAAGSGDKLRNMLDELRRLVDKYAKS
jgi:hypothetical protein